MNIITSIEPRRRMRGAYVLELDDGRRLNLHEEVIVKNKLHVGLELDPKRLAEWIYEADIKLAYDRALTYLSYRSRSRKELADYLAKKEYSKRVIEAVIEKLVDYKFIDDQGFAQRWVRDRTSGKPVGKRYIENELRNKGIDQELIDQALADIDQESEYNRALVLGQKYFNRHKDLEKQALRGKIGQALMRRGFDWETTSRVINKLVSQLEDDDFNLY